MSPNEQMGELRRKIEMRTVGLGWTEFETKWGYSNDEKRQKEAQGFACGQERKGWRTFLTVGRWMEDD